MMEESAASRASELPPTGLKTLLMEEVASSIRVLSTVSCELLAAENHDEQEDVAQAMTRALGWLHRQIAAPSYRQVAEEKILNELSQVFLHWHKQQTEKAMDWRFWMLWAELGCSLDVLRCSGAEAASFATLVRTSRPPENFPASLTHCNQKKQVAFSCELWDAVLGRPLDGAPTGAFDHVAPRLMEVFLHWMTTPMRGYEVAFIANVAAELRGHFAASTNSSLLVDALVKFAIFKMNAESISRSAASVAVTVVVLSGLTITRRTPEVVDYLALLSDATVDELSRGLFPHPHSPVAIVAMALGLALLDDARCFSTQLLSGNGTLLSQFALLRIACLPLLSSRLRPLGDMYISDYQTEVYRRLQTLVAEPSHAVLQEYSLRMAELCVEEMVGFFQTSLTAHLALLAAAQSVLPSELFRPKMLTQLAPSATNAVQDESLLATAPEIVSFLKQFYVTVAPTLKILSSGHLVRAFLALSRIEFAREVCASPTSNLSMQTVTQQLEQALEQTATPPEAIFAPILRSLAMHSMTANIDIPPEINIVAGCQTLAVGLVMQSKLRILLFQCTTLIDDALAVVFSGLYNVFEPVDAFAHRFLGVCLTHLAQFTPLFTVFPHYLQVTLAAYPANASRQALTKTCGAIFGSLFYSEALTMPTANDNEIVETAQRMVLWAIRKCCDRSSVLLIEEDKVAAEALPTKLTREKASGKPVAEDNSIESETDGLYLAGLVFELMKMAPMSILEACAMEVERLLARWKSNPRVLRELKSALFARISQNCEAEKRAWFAAWYIEVDNQYPQESVSKTTAPSRL
ncbi:hypothetical protein KRP22_012430 [Phytophthora ramorum]|nr:hypothetical protein KRP22_13172 [Phytophthora ramorum]